MVKVRPLPLWLFWTLKPGVHNSLNSLIVPGTEMGVGQPQKLELYNWANDRGHVITYIDIGLYILGCLILVSPN